MTISTNPFSVNGKTYQPSAHPIVVICIDGSADEYLDITMAHDRMPNLKRMTVNGYRGMVRGALPSFTNVNNSSIVTGASPAVHGISGNFFYNAAIDQEVMMNSSEYLRAETLLAAAANAGRKVAVVTAKEKLRDILSYKLNGIAFSAEKANLATKETHGIENAEEVIGYPTPAIYSAEASLFVLRAGAALIEKGIADFLYLSLTDYWVWVPTNSFLPCSLLLVLSTSKYVGPKSSKPYRQRWIRVVVFLGPTVTMSRI